MFCSILIIIKWFFFFLNIFCNCCPFHYNVLRHGYSVFTFNTYMVFCYIYSPNTGLSRLKVKYVIIQRYKKIKFCNIYSPNTEFSRTKVKYVIIQHYKKIKLCCMYSPNKAFLRSKVKYVIIEDYKKKKVTSGFCPS